MSDTQVTGNCWNYSTLTEAQLKAIVSGRAILGLNSRYFREVEREIVPGVSIHRIEKSRLPAWACLDCDPSWNELHRLAAQEFEKEDAKETACKVGDFEKAAAIHNAQQRLKNEHAQEVWAILSALARGALIEE